MSIELEMYQKAEVDWYRRYGRHASRRIRRDSQGYDYVIGDWSWNRKPGNPAEFIDDHMCAAVRERAK